MISVTEAVELIMRHRRHPATEEAGLLQSTGRVLARQVTADRDLPPYHRVTMDGIALNTHAVAAGNRSFRVEKVQPAGAPRQRLENSDHCIEVMTGAVLPENTDAVIPYEQCRIAAGVAHITAAHVPMYQFVHQQGTDGKAGAVLVHPGERITPAVAGIMASVGITSVTVYKLPAVAICSTGDELVEVTGKPETYQVRRSNVYSLAAALQPLGIQPTLLHVPDDPEVMAGSIAAIIETHDLTIFSGAVSKGKFDFLPEVLTRLGMQTVFHSVAQKPGKPLLFGTFGDKAIFGLPGNPVSGFVCFYLFVRAWVYRRLQITLPACAARLTREIIFKPSLSCHVLVQIHNQDGMLLATPCDSSGSGDLTSMLKADAILTLPDDGRDRFAAGEFFPVVLLAGNMF